MGRGKLEVTAAVKAARDWFYNEYGEELSLSELAKYFEDRYREEKRNALRDRFESYRGADLAVAVDVCASMIGSVARPARKTK